MKLNSFIFIIFMSIVQLAKANVYTVENNQDSGPGSLRQAITDANAHPGIDQINFSIPSASVVSRTISLSTGLPALTDPVVIDATTQSMGSAFGISYAKIQLTSEVVGLNQGFSLIADSCEIYGFFINGFKKGILISGTYSKIGAIQKGNVIFNCSAAGIDIQLTDHAALQGNFIGVDTVGNALTGATGNGVQIVNSYLVSIGGKTLLAYNVISGNNYGVRMQNATFVDLNSNNIGTGPSGLFARPNAYGIYCTGVNNNIEIGGDSLFERNLISGNTNEGIYGSLSSSLIQGNVIGLNAMGAQMGNGGYGIFLNFGSSDNLIGGELLKANTIAKNGQEAIAFQNTVCKRNTISRNKIFCNSNLSGSGGILLNGANGGIAPPQVAIVTPGYIAGYTIPGGIVEIFSNDSCIYCEGSNLLTSLTANANGVFAYAGNIPPSVTATVTDVGGNTSAFSTCKDTSSNTCMVAGFITQGNLCVTNAIQFLDQSVSVQGAEINSWNWNFGDGFTSSEAAPTHSYATTGTYTVQLISGNSTGCSDTVTKNIVINAVPVANFNVLPVSCVNSVVHFSDNSTGGTGNTITQRSWTFGDGGTSNAVNPAHTYTSPGIYTVTLMITNSSGCTSTKSSNVVIAPKPDASFTYQGINLTYAFNNTTPFNGPHTSLWDFGDGNTSILENPVHTFLNSGPYNVCLAIYDSTCASASISCNLIDIATGINDPGIQAGITVYPNPAHDYLTVNSLPTNLKAIIIASTAGKNMFEVAVDSKNAASITIPLPDLSAGMYLLYIQTDKGILTRKLVID